MKNVLYITEDIYSQVHWNLCKSLVKFQPDMKVSYLAMERYRTERPLRTNRIGVEGLSEIMVPCRYNKILYKYVFPYKVWKKKKLITEKVNVSDYNLVYASTLFSDGAIAYEIYKKYNIPYIVCVRGTDINLYISKMPFLYKYGRKIIENAKKIICISKSQKKGLICSSFSKKLQRETIDKIVVCPNGIDDFWHDNLYQKRRIACKNFVYIGIFDDDKNVVRLIEAFNLLKQEFKEIKLHLIGEGGSQEGLIRKMCDESIIMHGPIYDKEKLKMFMRSCDAFVMVSWRETFGLVYVEALSQGLPIIYSRNTGFDGMISDIKIGESCNPYDIVSIKDAMKNMIVNYDKYQLIGDRINEFKWEAVSDKIFDMIKRDNA